MRFTLGLALLTVTSLACEGRTATRPPEDASHAATVARLESPERDAWAMPDRVVAALPLAREDMDVADIGAGSGYFTRRIARRVPKGRVFAVDVDGTYKQYIRDNCESWGTPNIESRLALYENPLLPEQSLDLVFLSNTYSYIQDRQTYFAGVHASLRRQGRLVIVAFRADASCADIGEACPRDNERISADTVIAELAEAGFELDKQETFLPHQYMLVFARKVDRANASPDAPSESTDTSADVPADSSPPDAPG